MLRPDPKTITRLLQDAGAGEARASDSLLPLVYDELRGLANAVFSDERRGHTLQPTALIHEAWMKLVGHLGDDAPGFADRSHFFAVAARAMRQVLSDHARRNRSQKRGEGRQRVTIDEGHATTPSRGFDLIELDDSLNRLGMLNERHARVVELRILGGLTIAEAASTLGVSHSTVEADWFTAKAWLRTEMSGSR